MIFRESYIPPNHKLDENTLLDLVVNAVYFDVEYLNGQMLKEFPTSESLFQLFTQDKIVDKLTEDKKLDRDTALGMFFKYLSSHYGAYLSDDASGYSK